MPHISKIDQSTSHLDIRESGMAMKNANVVKEKHYFLGL